MSKKYYFICDKCGWKSKIVNREEDLPIDSILYHEKVCGGVY